jgi:hypothetical protein
MWCTLHIHSVHTTCVCMPRDLLVQRTTQIGWSERKDTRPRRLREAAKCRDVLASAAGPMLPAAGKDMEQDRAQHKNSGKNSELFVHSCQRRPFYVLAGKRHVSQPSLHITYHSSWSNIPILSAARLMIESMFIHVHMRVFCRSSECARTLALFMFRTFVHCVRSVLLQQVRRSGVSLFWCSLHSRSNDQCDALDGISLATMASVHWF